MNTINQGLKLNGNGEALSFAIRFEPEDYRVNTLLFVAPLRKKDCKIHLDDIIYYNNDWSRCGSIYGSMEEAGDQTDIVFSIELDTFDKEYEKAFVLMWNECPLFSQKEHSFFYRVNGDNVKTLSMDSGNILPKGHHLMGVVEKSEEGWLLTPCLHAQKAAIPDILQSLGMNEHVNSSWIRAQLGFAGRAEITPALRGDQLAWMNPEDLEAFFSTEYTQNFAISHGQIAIETLLTKPCLLTESEMHWMQVLVNDGAPWWQSFAYAAGLDQHMPTDPLEVVHALATSTLFLDGQDKRDWKRCILQTLPETVLINYSASGKENADNLYALWPDVRIAHYTSPRARKERLSEDLGL